MDKRETEQAIADLLQRYEAESGRPITGVFIISTELKRIGGQVTVHREVQLEAGPVPGSGWGFKS